jgi:hypothetical protein
LLIFRGIAGLLGKAGITALNLVGCFILAIGLWLVWFPNSPLSWQESAVATLLLIGLLPFPLLMLGQLFGLCRKKLKERKHGTAF